MARPPPSETPSKAIADDDPRINRWAQLTALAILECGGQEQASRWMHTPKIALKGKTPLAAMVTEEGCAAVEKLLRELYS